MMFSFSSSHSWHPCQKSVGLFRPGETADATSMLCQVHVLLSKKLARLPYSQGSIPKTWASGWLLNAHECDGDPSLGNGWLGFGGCQAAPSVGRNGGQGAGVSLHAVRFIWKEHTQVLSQRPQGEQLCSSPIAHKFINPSLPFQHKVCLKELVLPWQHLPPSSLLAGLHRHTKSCLSYHANRNPLGWSLTNAFFSSIRGKKGYFKLKSILDFILPPMMQAARLAQLGRWHRNQNKQLKAA